MSKAQFAFPKHGSMLPLLVRPTVTRMVTRCVRCAQIYGCSLLFIVAVCTSIYLE